MLYFRGDYFLYVYKDILIFSFNIFLINMRGSSSRQVCCLRCLAASGPGTELQSLVSNSRERYGQQRPAAASNRLKINLLCREKIGGCYWCQYRTLLLMIWTEYLLDALPQVHHRSDRGGDRGHSGELLACFVQVSRCDHRYFPYLRAFALNISLQYWLYREHYWRRGTQSLINAVSYCCTKSNF